MKRSRMTRNKFRNTIVVTNGITFRSKAESLRYEQLLILERAGEISNLVTQPRYPIEVNGRKVCTYVADFDYIDKKTQRLITEDVKGAKTQLYTLKRKLFEACYRRPVTEVAA